MKQYEYLIISVDTRDWIGTGKIDYGPLSARLDQLGGKGWDLVAAIDTNMYQGGTKEIALFLKREKSD